MRFVMIALAFAAAVVASGPLLAVEEAEYTVISSEGDIEVRQYAASIVAETLVTEDFEDAGNSAFRKLFGYIDGNNRSREEIAMTAPVSQQAREQKIAMTAPVSQQARGEDWAVSFMMPSSFTMETIPEPNDPAVVIRQIPAHRAVAIRYSGFWSEEKYRAHLGKLRSWIDEKGLETDGEPVWARYDAPFKPWFMRRNEVLIPVL